MKIKYSKIIPFKGFYAVNIFNTLFIREEYKEYPIPRYTINHEMIHTAQMKELGYVLFYIWYFIEWLIRLIINGKKAYKYISFEREANSNELDLTYLRKRKHYSWIKHYGK